MAVMRMMRMGEMSRLQTRICRFAARFMLVIEFVALDSLGK